MMATIILKISEKKEGTTSQSICLYSTHLESVFKLLLSYYVSLVVLCKLRIKSL